MLPGKEKACEEGQEEEMEGEQQATWVDSHCHLQGAVALEVHTHQRQVVRPVQ